MRFTYIHSTVDTNYRVMGLLGEVLYKSVSVVPLSILWHPIAVKRLDREHVGDF